MKQYDKKLSAVLHNCREFSAITQTIDASAKEAQYLKFTVNGDKEVTAADLKKEGYTVNFLTNKTGVVEASTGKVLAQAGTEFKYQVEISKEGTDKITSPEAATVKVEDASAVVTSLTKIVPVVDTEAKTSNTVAKGDEVKFKVYGTYKNDPTKEVEIKDYSKVTLTSSKATTLYIGSDKTATAISAGEVTVTAKVGELTTEQAITISDEAATLDKVTADKTEVTVAKSGEAANIKVSAVDTFGDAFTLADETGKKVEAAFTPAKDAEGKATTAAATAAVTYKDGVATVAVTGTAKGNGTLTLTVGEKEVKVDVTILEAGKVTEQKIAGKDTVDLVDAATFNYTLQGYDAQGLASGEAATLPTTEGAETSYKVKTSDKTVATAAIVDNKIVVTPKKAGEVTVTLEQYEGTLATPKETFTKTIKVEDARVALTEATLATELPKFSFAQKTADFAKVLKEIKLSDDTAKAEYVVEDNKVVIKDTNEDVENNVLGTVEFTTVGKAGAVTVAQNADTKAITLTSAEGTGTGAVVVKVTDANGKELAEGLLEADFTVAAKAGNAKSQSWVDFLGTGTNIVAASSKFATVTVDNTTVNISGSPEEVNVDGFWNGANDTTGAVQPDSTNDKGKFALITFTAAGAEDEELLLILPTKATATDKGWTTNDAGDYTKTRSVEFKDAEGKVVKTQSFTLVVSKEIVEAAPVPAPTPEA